MKKDRMKLRVLREVIAHSYQDKNYLTSFKKNSIVEIRSSLYNPNRPYTFTFFDKDGFILELNIDEYEII